jgi:hypothetical protein
MGAGINDFAEGDYEYTQIGFSRPSLFFGGIQLA